MFIRSMPCARMLALAAAVFCLALLQSGEANADYLDGWNWRSPLAQGSNLNDITYGGTLWAAVGDKGAIATSPDGRNWNSRWSAVSQNLRGVAYGNGVFVAVGEAGRVLYSGDGLAWSSTSVGTTDDLGAVAFGGGQFVALGRYDSQKLYVSADGRNWQAGSGPYGVVPLDLRYCGNKFFLVGGSSDGYRAHSSGNGASWTGLTVGATNDALTGLACGGTPVVIGSLLGSYFSNDGGATWMSAATTTWYRFNHLAYGNGIYAAANDSGEIYTSTDGRSWSRVATPTSGPLKRLAYGGGGFVAVGTNGRIAASTDGNAWSMAAAGGGRRIFSNVAYGNGVFVVAGTGVNPAQDNADTLLSSSDGGRTWTARKSGVFYGLDFVNDRFIAVGHNSTLMQSVDGVTWENGTTTGYGSFYGVAYGNCRYVVTGGNNAGAVNVSYDGKNWRGINVTDPQISPLGFSGATYGNGLFMTVGTGYIGNGVWGAVVFVSSDGENWTRITAPQGPSSLNHVAYGNGVFVANGGGLYATTDGRWTKVSDAATNSVIFSQGMFLAVDYYGNLQVSTDGYSWQAKTTPSSGALYGLAFGAGTVVVAGENDAVLQSDSSGSCYTNSPASVALPFAGGSGTVGLTAATPASCTWRVATPTPWLTLAAPVSGTGNGQFAASAQSNSCPGWRQGELWVDGRSLVVRQPPSDSDRVFNWAEASFPTLLAPAGQTSQSASGYYFRFYQNTGKAVGSKDGGLYYYDGVSISPLPVSLSDYLNQASNAGY